MSESAGVTRSEEDIDGKKEARTFWLTLFSVLAAIGIAISVYTVIHHQAVHADGQTDMACNINDTISCDTVALSEFSEIGGIPLGVFGIGYFAALILLSVLGMRGGKIGREHLNSLFAMVGVGVLTSLILGVISFTQIGAMCISCMGVYAVTFVMGGLLVPMRHIRPGSFNLTDLLSGGTSAAIVVAGVVVAWSLLGSSTNKTTADGDKGNTDLPAFSDIVNDIPLAKSAYAGLGEDYRKGSDSAKVVVQEFADFQCPACKQIGFVLQQLKSEYGDRVLFVYRNYPLDKTCNGSVKVKMHEQACATAVLARCAGQYGKFWPYHDLVFANQKDISSGTIKQWARDVGLTDEQITACEGSPDILAKIRDDIKLGDKVGVTSTPSIYINGRKYVGRKGYADLKAEIDRLLLN